MQAVRAALALHEMARGLSGEVEKRTGQPLRLHSGINSGLIVARSRDRRDGTFGVTGDAVNTAARLVGQAAVDEVVVSPYTQRLVREYFVTETLAPVTLKGKAEPVQPYRIVGKTSVATRWEAAQQRGLTRYAGREEELAMLRKAVERTLAGSGQFATVMGEAGIGKSRLMFEFRHNLGPKAITVLHGGGSSSNSIDPGRLALGGRCKRRDIKGSGGAGTAASADGCDDLSSRLHPCVDPG